MTLDDITADVPFTMTCALIRLFKFAGCHPTICHSCLESIDDGDVFKLASGPDGLDHMLCAGCTIADWKRRQAARKVAKTRRQNRWDQDYLERYGHQPGFSRPSHAH